jgi:hypothetical protein
MADDRKPPEPTPQPQPSPAAAPRTAPPVVEREPLTVTVVQPAPSEVAVPQQVRVEAPPSIDLRRTSLAWLLMVAAVLALIFYRLQLSPLVQRFEHGLQRRVFGERFFEAHRAPHSRFDQLPRAHEDAAHR